jgi:hypothetical protein
MGSGVLELDSHALGQRAETLEHILRAQGEVETHTILRKLRMNSIPLSILNLEQFQEATKDSNVYMLEIYADGEAFIRQDKEFQGNDQKRPNDYYILEKKYGLFHVIDPDYTVQ